MNIRKVDPAIVNLEREINKALDDLLSTENKTDRYWLFEYTVAGCSILKHYPYNKFEYKKNPHWYDIMIYYDDKVAFNYKAIYKMEERDHDIFRDIYIYREKGMLVLNISLWMLLSENIIEIVKTNSEIIAFNIPTMFSATFDSHDNNERNERRAPKSIPDKFIETEKFITEQKNTLFGRTQTGISINGGSRVDPEDWIRVENFAWYARICVEGFSMQKLIIDATNDRYRITLWFDANAFFAWRLLAQFQVLSIMHFDDFFVYYDPIATTGDGAMILRVEILKGAQPLFATKARINYLVSRTRVKMNKSQYNIEVQGARVPINESLFQK